MRDHEDIFMKIFLGLVAISLLAFMTLGVVYDRTKNESLATELANELRGSTILSVIPSGSRGNLKTAVVLRSPKGDRRELLVSGGYSFHFCTNGDVVTFTLDEAGLLVISPESLLRATCQSPEQ